jgi:hypothetical protein
MTRHAEMIGWRYWQVARDGHLVSGCTQPLAVWANGGLTACCYYDRHPGEAPPAAGCECGVRVMPDLADLLHAVRHEPGLVGIHPMKWMHDVGLMYCLDRARHGVLQVPDVIGQVVVSGPVEDGYGGWPRRDPAGTLRVERARVGRVLHLSAHLAHMVPAISLRYSGVTIRVGEARGLGWLDEVEVIGDQVDLAAPKAKPKRQSRGKAGR